MSLSPIYLLSLSVTVVILGSRSSAYALVANKDRAWSLLSTPITAV